MREITVRLYQFDEDMRANEYEFTEEGKRS